MIRDLDYNVKVSLGFQKERYYNPELTEDIYEHYFDTDISFEDAAEKWGNKDIDLSDLNRSFKDEIIDNILKGGTVWDGHHDDGKGSHTYDCGNYSIYLDEEIADEDRPIMIFGEDSPVSDELKRKVLEEVVHYDKDIGYIEDFNDDRVWQVTVDEESIHRSRIDSDYIEGVVNVNQEGYSFDYNPETDEIEIHKYSEPGWMTGESKLVMLWKNFLKKKKLIKI